AVVSDEIVVMDDRFDRFLQRGGTRGKRELYVRRDDRADSRKKKGLEWDG
ncbi:hypothetical protein WUBG_15971, partial [Wuchereria bancrofti]